MTDPERVLIVGDVHGNTRWMVHVIDRAAAMHADRILQLGDFGIDNEDAGLYYLQSVQLALEAKGLELDFIDGNHECVDMSTRAVTKRGILTVDELRDGDLVLSADDSGQRLWQPVLAIIRRPCRGSIWKLESRGVSAAVTAGHRVVGRAVRSGRWLEYAGDSLSGRQFNLVVSAGNPGPDRELEDDEIRLLAWCLTDSHRRADGSWHFYQRESQASQITGLLKRLDIPYSASTRRRDIQVIAGRRVLSSEPEVTVRVGVGASRARIPWVPGSLPPLAWELSARQVRVFLDELVFCDGSWATANRTRTGVLYCPEQELREQLLTLLTANGFRASVSVFGENDWRLNFCERSTLQVDTRPRGHTRLTSSPHDGEVWCVRVPNGRFFVEREGRVHLTGNCHDWIDSWQDPASPAIAACVPGFDRIRHLPRGYRWSWHGRNWLAAGGAVSVDQGNRTDGYDWFPQESITEEQEDEIIASQAGRETDVMVTHDCPADVFLTLPAPLLEWLPYINAAEEHRRRLQRIVDVAEPAYLMHGHYHMLHSKSVQMSYGPCLVTGLHRDGVNGSYVMLNVATMEWEVR
jgi:hypothetical protein